MLYIPYTGGVLALVALNIGGGAISMIFFVWPYFRCNSGSDAEV